MSTLNIFTQPLCSGDTIPLKLTFTDKTTGAVHDLTGSTVGATVKAQPDDLPDASEAVWMQDVHGDTTGIIQFYISPLAVGDWWLDIVMWNSTGIRTTVLAPVQLHILQSVSARLVPSI